MNHDYEQMSATSFSSTATIIAFLFFVLCSRVEGKLETDQSDRRRLNHLWQATLKQPELKYAIEKLNNGNVIPREVSENIFDVFDEPGVKIPILRNLSVMGAHGNPGLYKNDQSLFLPAEPGSANYEINKHVAVFQEKSTLNESQRYAYTFVLIRYVGMLRAAYSNYRSSWNIVRSRETSESFLDFETELWALSRDPEHPTTIEKDMAAARIRLHRSMFLSSKEQLLKSCNALESLVGTSAISALEKDFLASSVKSSAKSGDAGVQRTPACATEAKQP